MKRRKIPPLSHTPREYQAYASHRVQELIIEQPETWHLFTAPTGTGKSICELLVLEDVPDSILITPRVEIIRDMLRKVGQDAETDAEIVEKGSSYGLFTPIRLRNMLANGTLPFVPSLVILDEAHHSLADSWQDIQMYLNGVPVVGFTATPFRGTPKGTEGFRQQWGTITPLLTLREAIAKGYCSMPVAELWPMVDDDMIDVTNGEIKVSQASSLILTKVDSVIYKMSGFYDKRAKIWDRPTMLSVPTTETANHFVKRFNESGYPAVAVTQASTRTQRERAFRSVVNQDKVLVQIDVVSEGVDLPIRRLIDLRPTMSPVKWLQQLGRIMRPVMCMYCRRANRPNPNCSICEPMPEYICCCRNLERHGYLMEGFFPPDKLKEAQEMFKSDNGEPVYSKRSGSRALGLEGLGKFVTTPVHLLNGLTAFAYNLVYMDGYKKREYFVLIHPSESEPLYAVKESTKTGTDDEGRQKYDYGKWVPVASLPDIKGCVSAKPGDLTPGQQNWWNDSKKGAASVGLNPHKPVNNRNFQVLPVLKNLGVKL